ncbi:unnamed protein product [Caenorhabditis auriculariae]|uniref:Palmitoyltransferase n=1 Tax=Caenorhabditis auriculariae TaxID=2777116 RepID=A0A8S1H8R1_9PELO|nr:unnamed protein product [Caenorhabditis auriculariae]
MGKAKDDQENSEAEITADCGKTIRVVEPPNWPAPPMEIGEKRMFRRIFFWGTLIALVLISFIGATTLYFAIQWMSLTELFGFCNLATFFFFNYFTLNNFVRASIVGPGYVPRGWRPQSKEAEGRLQFCEPCGGYKAPRSHHCSKCRRCCMKMDHHCPWINNCVGHRNHAYFVRFLGGAIFGCVHAFTILFFTVYYAFNVNYYIMYGDGTEPLIYMDLFGFFALVAALAFSAGVAIALTILLYFQLKYILKNKNSIEEYIDLKAHSSRDDDEHWVYPYDLGFKRNFLEVLGSFRGETKGNGTWWPVREGSDQFTFTEEQLRLKRWKQEHSRVVSVLKDFPGGFCASRVYGWRVFLRQPLIDGSTLPMKTGDRLVCTRGSKEWLYGFVETDPHVKGWVPRQSTDLVHLKKSEFHAEIDWAIMEKEKLSSTQPFSSHFSARYVFPKRGMNHVDVDQVLEDYAWHQFKDLQSLRKTRLDDFKTLDKDDCEFVINRKHLVVLNEDPQYSNFAPAGAKPYTLFKSVYTNSTNRPQEYSFKTERTTESLVSVAREQGFMIGTEAELTLKTPCEVAEMKAGFKHEMHFNNLSENCKTEVLTWGVDSNVQVPPRYMTEASIIIEEMNYRGSYSVVSRLSGNVVVSIRRRKDNALVLPIRVGIVEVFRSQLDSPHCKKKSIKQVVSIDQNKFVRLISKGNCQFQFAMKQRIDLKENPMTRGDEIMID